MARRVSFLAVLVCALCSPLTAVLSAQTYTGGLRGAVSDAQGIVPGATVTLINEQTSAKRATTSNDVGRIHVRQRDARLVHAARRDGRLRGLRKSRRCASARRSSW